MTLERLRAAYHAEPFRPFTIRLTDGRAFDVTQWGCMSISPSGRFIVVVGPGESFAQIEVADVTDMTIYPAGPADENAR